MFTVIKREERGRRKMGEREKEKEKRMGERKREREVVLFFLLLLLPSKISIYWALTVTSYNADYKLLENIALSKQSLFLKP